MVKNLPFNVGDSRLIPGQRTKIPYAVEQTHASQPLSLHATTTEKPMCRN